MGASVVPSYLAHAGERLEGTLPMTAGNRQKRRQSVALCDAVLLSRGGMADALSVLLRASATPGREPLRALSRNLMLNVPERQPWLW